MGGAVWVECWSEVWDVGGAVVWVACCWVGCWWCGGVLVVWVLEVVEVVRVWRVRLNLMYVGFCET